LAALAAIQRVKAPSPPTAPTLARLEVADVGPSGQRILRQAWNGDLRKQGSSDNRLTPGSCRALDRSLMGPRPGKAKGRCSGSRVTWPGVVCWRPASYHRARRHSRLRQRTLLRAIRYASGRHPRCDCPGPDPPRVASRHGPGRGSYQLEHFREDAGSAGPDRIRRMLVRTNVVCRQGTRRQRAADWQAGARTLENWASDLRAS